MDGLYTPLSPIEIFFLCIARSCQKVGKTTLGLAIVVVTIGLLLIFMFDLPGSDDVGGGPMTKYKLITTHFQVSI
jgi:hypothetical protein